MRTLLAAYAAMVLVLSGCAGGERPIQRTATLQPRAVPSDARFAFRTGSIDNVTFRGALDSPSSGTTGPGGMLYPAPDPLTFLVAVGVHAAISSNLQAKQAQQQQMRADAVLLQFRPTLNRIKHRELLHATVSTKTYPRPAHVLDVGEVDDGAWVVDTVPVYTMTQDKSALVLDNLIRVFEPGKPKQPVYQNVMRVVSTPAEAGSGEAAWTEDDGALLHRTIERQFARSLDLAILDFTTSPAPGSSHKTIHYTLGRTEKMERGELLRNGCSELVIRTLRGWVMSATPIAREAESDDAPCID